MFMGFLRITAIMKVMIFPVKFDKFTGFFDKFLKNDGQIKHCNEKGYHINLSVSHSDMAQKKFFGNRAFARNRPHSGAAAQGNSARSGCAMRPRTASLPGRLDCCSSSTQLPAPIIPTDIAVGWERERTEAFQCNDELFALLPKGGIALPGSGITDNFFDESNRSESGFIKSPAHSSAYFSSKSGSWRLAPTRFSATVFEMAGTHHTLLYDLQQIDPSPGAQMATRVGRAYSLRALLMFLCSPFFY